MSLEEAQKKFNPYAYLAANKDLLEHATVTPDFSPWEHFLTCGHIEGRSGVDVEVFKLVQIARKFDPLCAAPPPHLRKRVHGAEDLAGYEVVGRIVAMNVLGQLYAASLKQGAKILDFGSGPGRVIKPLFEMTRETHMPNAREFEWFGCDIDAEAIEWCQKFLHQIGDFRVNDINPPLPYEADTFDFIYSISIFTHLPEDMQFAWLEELTRVAKSGATVVLTTHGPGFGFGNQKQRAEFSSKGFLYWVGPDTDGLPSFYQTAQHSHEYIRRKWSKYFEIVNIIPKGIANNQDMVVCKRR